MLQRGNLDAKIVYSKSKVVLYITDCAKLWNELIN